MDYNELAKKMFLMENQPELVTEEDIQMIEKEMVNLNSGNKMGQKFMTAIQKEGVRFFVDFIKNAMTYNERIQDHIEMFREAFFVDGPINYDVVFVLSNSILTDVRASDLVSDRVKAYAEMLVEAIEGQKAYNVLEFI